MASNIMSFAALAHKRKEKMPISHWDDLRIEVQLFALEMERELRVNDSKKDLKNVQCTHLQDKLEEELYKVWSTLKWGESTGHVL